MSSEAPSAPDKHPDPGRGSYALLAAGVLCVTAAELLFKHGAAATSGVSGAGALFGFSVLASGWTWLGIAAYISASVAWMNVLRRMPLHIAFSMMSADQALVPLSAWALLGESISPRRWCGIALVITGIYVIARPAAQCKEQL
ncbi:MAG: hypothetical protein RLZZ265_2561 [Verrucomicrobiota bacterium]|jgi:multidrug transporter EmrE-like cation transporter